ncbi:hypothetical protein ACQPW3_20355 [Actinosynnema sp. CA-248983]
MGGEGSLLTDSAVWGTFGPEKKVLAVARTLTSAIRLLEALRAFAGDPRVGVVWTVDERSRNSTGVKQFVESLPARVIPVGEVPDQDFHLVLAASEKLDLVLRRPTPMVVLPHGIGFNKYVPDVDAPGTRLSGMVSPEVLRAGQVRMLVTHPAQAAQVAASSQAAVGRTVLGGDTSLDLLLESASLRSRYREALGLADGQRLVLVASTWRNRSLLGADPTLPARLVGELPADEYRVAMVAHPNVWTWEGGWELRRVLDTALRSGLLLIEPTRGWHAAMVAADLVIGDHGSLSLYAATTGVPLLLGAFGDDEVVAGTAMDDLGRRAPRIDTSQPLQPQIAAHAGHRRVLVAMDEVFARPGAALSLLRAHCYDILKLPEPEHAADQAVAPDPDAALPPLHSLEVLGAAHGGEVSLRRFPLPVRALRKPTQHDEVRHVSVDDRERNVRRYADAAVVVRATEADGTWPADVLTRFPGSRVAGHATPDGCIVLIRGLGRFAVRSTSRDVAALASAVYTRLVHTGEVTGTFGLRVGPHTAPVTVT